MKKIFDEVSYKCSKLTTNAYSTSFSLGIKLLSRDMQGAIYAIYGFVRFADEIVDTFHDFKKEELLDEFKAETHKAIKDQISLNPIINSFQHTVNKYGIPLELIDQFLHSMKMDLQPQEYSREKYEEYILGSAEVVGLMTLKVFLNGDHDEYLRLKPNAMALGSAFQKVNFLRDLHADHDLLGRSYFPGVNLNEFNEESKRIIEDEIALDFQEAYKGIVQLPKKARFGVYLAYVYYKALFEKIKSTPSAQVKESRIRIPNEKKYALLLSSYVRNQIGMI